MKSQVIYVLLVEDDIDYSALLRRRLMGGLNQDTDLTFVVAQTGLLNEAIEYTLHHAVDVIVLDLNLPDASGLETLAHMREVAPNAGTIVLTGRDDQVLAAQALKMGAQDYLCKGNFNTELLIRTIRYAIDRKESERALSQVEEKLRHVNQHRGYERQDRPKSKMEAELTEAVSSEEIANDFDTLLARMAAQNSLALAQLPTDNPARVHMEKLNQTINMATDLTRRLFNGLRGSKR
jgi:DNA-binding response OmpR family regulator